MPTLHFLEKSYKFVQELPFLQICYNVEHFLEDSDNFFAKIAEKKTKNVMCYFDQKFKIIKLPATTATFTVSNAQTASGLQQKGQNG